jgi:hypothetical protein
MSLGAAKNAAVKTASIIFRGSFNHRIHFTTASNKSNIRNVLIPIDNRLLRKGLD